MIHMDKKIDIQKDKQNYKLGIDLNGDTGILKDRGIFILQKR